MKTFTTSILLFFVIIAHAQLKAVKDGLYHWEEPIVNANNEVVKKTLLKGSSPHLEYLNIEAVAQDKGSEVFESVNKQDLETVLIIKSGTAKVTIEGQQSTTIGPTSVVMVMPQQNYTIEHVGNSRLTYYKMSYRSKKNIQIARGETHGGTTVFNADKLKFKPSKRGGGVAYFDRPTAMCERFEMHITQLNKKGPSHKPHTHIESEIILVISGDTKMIIGDKTYQGSAGGFYYANAYKMHGISNAADKPCKYFAFKWN